VVRGDAEARPGQQFWFGHQGWEYVDIGRFWQWFLFIGLLLWLVLVGRALWPALARKDEMSSIVGLLFCQPSPSGCCSAPG
jgi:nitric oxide reductase subunit B